MKKKISGLTLCALLFVLSIPVQAQQSTKIPRIGYLTGAYFSAIAARREGFRQGLRDLGYEEGKNIVIEWRSAEGNLDRLPALAAELVKLKVDLIVSAGPVVTRPTKEATNIIPIVMAQDDDPVSNGFVASLARPGGNITGLSTLARELSGKKLELLKETIPGLSRVAVFGSSAEPANARALKDIELAAGAFGLRVQYLEIDHSKDIERAFRAADKLRSHAVLMIPSGPLTNAWRPQIAELAVQTRLPVLWNREYVEAGGLMSYGVSLPDMDRRAATYVDRS